ncbi:hypothetical protein BC834DRAFT_855414 [Gloeopeniophorella convolvens]|nr:hypothetical protein BC834DRAFT_855414 [Gloeopeniophorella convolvens]
MPRRKDGPKRLKQQNLVEFFRPAPSTARTPRRDGRSRTKLRSSVNVKQTSPRRAIELSDADASDSDVDAIHFEPKKDATPHDSDDMQPSPPKQRRGKAPVTEPRSGSVISLSSDSDGLGKSKGPSRTKRLGRRNSSAEQDPPPASKRSRLAKGVRPSTPEEPDDLLKEVDEADIIDSRLRSRSKRTSFQENLDKLKKKKLGRKSVESDDEATVEDSDQGRPFEGAYKKCPQIVSDEGGEAEDDDDDNDNDDDTDDFVVEDDGTAVPELPVAFSRHSHQDTSHDFKIVCQLLVHLAVIPMDERRSFMEQALKGDGYFAISLNVIRRKISGTRDSIASSVWRPNFRKALESYPDLTLTRLDFAIPQCDACHLGGRLSTLSGYLKGLPYDELTFEPISSESDSEDSDDETSYPTSLSLGRFCAARTQIFHRLTHWRYHLYRSLSEEVDLAQRPSKKRPFMRSAFAKNLPPPTDASNADDIMEWLDNKGTISVEWQKLRELLQRASTLDASANKREEDVDLDI